MKRRGGAGTSAYGLGGLVPPAPAAPSGKFLNASGQWATPSGGGVTNHADLYFRGWNVSGHTGTALALAAFASTTTATYALIGTHVQAYAPSLASLVAASTAAGLPRLTAANVWERDDLGDLAVSGGAWQVTQARGLRETSGPTTLVVGAVADGQLLRRVGATIVGAYVALCFLAPGAFNSFVTPEGGVPFAGSSWA